MGHDEIEATCDECGHVSAFSTEDAGSIQRCSACGNTVDVPDLLALQAKETDRQLAISGQQQIETARQLEIVQRQQRQYQAQLDRHDALDQRQEQLLEAAERVVARWEALASRLEQVLSKLERKG